MTFKLGVSGNPKGRPRDANRPLADTIRRAILADKGASLRKAAEALLRKASDGDLQAISMLGDRTDGKPVQQIQQELVAEMTIRLDSDDVEG